MQLKLAKELNELYIEYINDFLTVECFARYKGFRLDFAKAVINAGRKINSNQTLLEKIWQFEYFENLYDESVLYDLLCHSFYDQLYIDYYKA